MRERIAKQEKRGRMPLDAAIILVVAYVLTAIILLLLALVLYKFRISEKIINLAIVVIYVLMTFFAGFVAGKKFKVKKFLWGLILGSAYFLVLFLVSAIMGTTDEIVGNRTITTFLLCAGGGMLGGMLS